ncbi:hypothetical protein CMI44_01300 [Candidatus Pacearchaeota archaeon]|jgi:7-cyano-7-deazaguanine synthase|nr:hypothetical protein [Candidatus Pacearchaeota archaeon]
MKNAVVLVSGGMDSVVLAHYLKKKEKLDNLLLVFIDYGQQSFEEEKFCVENTVKELGAELKIIDAKWLGKISTSLINKKIDEEKLKGIEKEDEIISWYVPCRNALFLLMGLAIAESEFISKKEKYGVYIGIKYEGELQFKDTTPEFVGEMNKLVNFCTQEGNLKFVAPFLEKEKEEVIELAKELEVGLEKTYSCYVGRGFDENKIPIHCGICGSCKARKKAFKFSEIKDPTIYKNV